MKLCNNGTIIEIIRFGIVGCIVTLIHYVVYLILMNWIDYNISYTIGYIISFVCNFILTTYFTFQKKATVKRGVGFLTAHLFNYFFQILLLDAFIKTGISESFAPLIVYIIVIPVNFIMVRFVFKNRIINKRVTDE